MKIEVFVSTMKMVNACSCLRLAPSTRPVGQVLPSNDEEDLVSHHKGAYLSEEELSDILSSGFTRYTLFKEDRSSPRKC